MVTLTFVEHEYCDCGPAAPSSHVLGSRQDEREAGARVIYIHIIHKYHVYKYWQCKQRRTPEVRSKFPVSDPMDCVRAATGEGTHIHAGSNGVV